MLDITALGTTALGARAASFLATAAPAADGGGGDVSLNQKIGVIVAAVLVVGWAVFLWSHLKSAGYGRDAETKLAPNRKPGMDDEFLETARLDRALSLALVLLAAISLLLPAYWLKEESRKVGAVEYFNERAVAEGHSLFLSTTSTEHGAHFGCADCHGADGSGGVANYALTDYLGRTRQVKWAAPSLNDVAYKYTDEQLRSVLEYGRAGTPMPAWGAKGGGPMSQGQIDSLVAYLNAPKEHHGLKLSKEEAMKQAFAKAEQQANKDGRKTGDGKPIVDGQTLFNAHCARCHTRGFQYDEPGVAGGGAYGKPLTNGSTLRQFPKAEDHTVFVAEGVAYGKQYGQSGIGQIGAGGMPKFGDVLTKEQLQMIIDYERSL